MTIKCDTLDKTNGSPEGDKIKTEKLETIIEPVVIAYFLN